MVRKEYNTVYFHYFINRKYHSLSQTSYFGEIIIAGILWAFSVCWTQNVGYVCPQSHLLREERLGHTHKRELRESEVELHAWGLTASRLQSQELHPGTSLNADLVPTQLSALACWMQRPRSFLPYLSKHLVYWHTECAIRIFWHISPCLTEMENETESKWSTIFYNRLATSTKQKPSPHCSLPYSRHILWAHCYKALRLFYSQSIDSTYHGT